MSYELRLTNHNARSPPASPQYFILAIANCSAEESLRKKYECAILFKKETEKEDIVNHEEENVLWKKVAERIRLVLYRAVCVGKQGERKIGPFIDKLPMTAEEQTLSEHHLGFVHKIAASHWRRRGWRLGFSVSDLSQEGYFGLIKAIRRFDKKKGFAFTTHAEWWVRQEMVRYMDNNGRLLHIPANRQEELRKKKGDEYEKFCNEFPGVDLFDGEEEWDRIVLRGDNEQMILPLPPEDIILEKDWHEKMSRAIHTAFALLLERDREILILRFGLNGSTKESTLEEIGARFAITRQRVLQLEKRATLMLKNNHPKELEEFLPVSRHTS